VFDETGVVAISLSVYGLPTRSSTEQVLGCRDALAELADEVVNRIGARTPVTAT